MTIQLKYLSDGTLGRLRGAIPNNLERYRNSGFESFAADPGWDVHLGIEFDDQKLNQLDLSQPSNIAPVDLKNSKIIGEALSQLDAATANEERIWVRLAHVEAIEYSRRRWLGSASDADIPALVADHFFAPTQTGIRDDHALSRLWWNYYVAKLCLPDNVDLALSLILKTADIRSNFVERIWMTSRRSIAGAVLKLMETEPWVTGAEKNFREFMKSLNRLGGGVVFEALSDSETDSFVRECMLHAQST